MSDALKKQLPMMATYSRIVAAPILILLMANESKTAHVLAALLFILSSMTDWLDGYWARKYKAESAMGKFMDPIADKIIVLSALIMLLHKDQLDPYMVILFLSRDIYIGGLRSVAAANQIIIAAKPFGKWKTALQMFAIPCLILSETIDLLPLYPVGYYLLWFSVGLSLISGIQYAIGYYKGRVT